ncbi:DUF3617 family protein [Chitinimonas viridis]|uniref:DUF3617 family protein n=1 Tax=Chitinimonas viridis TaxID=664880 RepID=A0ABT8B1S3_9NEIS|nr:DUF3617 family protein [Chitinimonas viridis]MDN3575621.1 DUF3617 family protein [Chitinimonas viridis]
MSRLARHTCLILFTAAVWANPAIRPGMWSITSKMNMEGMKVNIPPTTVKQCMKPEDAQNMTRPAMPKSPDGKAPACTMLSNSMTGNTMVYRMKCTGAQPSEISGSMTFGTDSYSGKTTVDSMGPQGRMRMSTEFSAKRLGDCK